MESLAVRPGRFVAVGGGARLRVNVDGPGKGNHMVYLKEGRRRKRGQWAAGNTESCSGACVGLGDALESL